MKSIGKFIAAFLLFLLLLLIAAGFALTHFVDPNSYKAQLQQLARDKGKVELELNGDIGWSLFPWLGLELTDTRIASLDTPDKPFADVKLLALSVRVLPLLKKEVQMSDVRLDGLNLELYRDADGIGNWEYIGKTLEEIATHKAQHKQRLLAKQQPEHASDNTTAAVESRLKPLRLDIDSLIINSARISYQDQQTGQQFVTENLQITTGAIREDTQFPVKFSGFTSVQQPNLRTRFAGTADATIDRSNQRYLVENLQLESDLTGELLLDKPLTVLARGNLSYQADQAAASWEQLRLTLNQLKVSGELALTQLKTAPTLNGSLNIPTFNAQDFLRSIGRPLPTTLAPTAFSQVSLFGKLQGTYPEFSATDLTLALDNTQLTGSISYLPSSEQPNLTLSLQGDQLNLDQYLLSQTNPANAERQQAIQQQLENTPSAAAINSTAAPATAAAYHWDTQSVLPIHSLAALDLKADLQLGSLTYQQLPLKNLNLQATAKHNIVNLEQFYAQLFGGSLTASASLNQQAEIPQLKLQSKIVHLPLEPVLTALNKPVTLTGNLDNSATLSTQGSSQQQWIKQLQGQYSFELHNGQLRDTNLDQQLCLGIAALNRKTPSKLASTQQHTAFNQISGSLQIKQGIAHSQNVVVSLPGLKANGKGDVDLNQLTLNYQLGLKLLGDQRPMPDPACQVNPRIAAIEWPFHCQGPLELAAKSCRFDQERLGHLLKQSASQELSHKLQQQLDKKLKDKAPPELQEALKGLFK